MPNCSELARQDDDREADVHRHGGDSLRHASGQDGLWAELCEARREIERLKEQSERSERDLEAAIHAMVHAGLGVNDVVTVPLKCEMWQIALEEKNEKLRAAHNALLAERDDLRSQLETALALKADYFSECVALRAGLAEQRERIGRACAPLASAVPSVG